MILLDRLADQVGISPFFHDIWGKKHEASAETKKKILRAMRFKVDSDAEAEQELTELEQKQWTEIGPPVWVVYRDSVKPIPIQIPVRKKGLNDGALSFRFTLTDEDGEVREESVSEQSFPEKEKA